MGFNSDSDSDNDSDSSSDINFDNNCVSCREYIYPISRDNMCDMCKVNVTCKNCIESNPCPRLMNSYISTPIMPNICAACHGINCALCWTPKHHKFLTNKRVRRSIEILLLIFKRLRQSNSKLIIVPPKPVQLEIIKYVVLEIHEYSHNYNLYGYDGSCYHRLLINSLKCKCFHETTINGELYHSQCINYVVKDLSINGQQYCKTCLRNNTIIRPEHNIELSLDKYEYDEEYLYDKIFGYVVFFMNDIYELIAIGDFGQIRKATPYEKLRFDWIDWISD